MKQHKSAACETRFITTRKRKIIFSQPSETQTFEKSETQTPFRQNETPKEKIIPPFRFVETAFEFVALQEVVTRVVGKVRFIACLSLCCSGDRAFDSSLFPSFRPRTMALCGLPPFLQWENVFHSGHKFLIGFRRHIVCRFLGMFLCLGAFHRRTEHIHKCLAYW